MPEARSNIDPNAPFILAFCPNEGPPRFMPYMKASDIILMTWDEAHSLGEQTLRKREQKAYQVWAVGPTYQAEVTIIQRELPTT